MTRQAVTVELDNELVEAVRSAARRAGIAEAELYERALREVLVRDFAALMDDIAAFQVAHDAGLTDEEAMELAVSELAALRAERRSAS